MHNTNLSEYNLQNLYKIKSPEANKTVINLNHLEFNKSLKRNEHMVKANIYEVRI